MRKYEEREIREKIKACKIYICIKFSNSIPAPSLQFRPPRRICRWRRCIECRRCNRRRGVIDHHHPPFILGPQKALGVSAASQAPHAGTALAVSTQRPSPTRQQFFTIVLLLVVGSQDPAIKKKRTKIFIFKV